MPARDQIETPAKSTTGEMGILEHLGELRKRLLYSAIALIICVAVGYYFVEEVFKWLCAPFLQSFSHQSLIGTGPAEAIIIKIKVAFFAGIILGLPFFSYQLWAFINPALYEKEKKSLLPASFCLAFLFIIGVLFCYYFILPVAFSFFSSEYLSIGLEPNIRISEQISTSLSMLISFGVIFEIPLLVYFLSKMGLVSPEMLINTSRYSIVGIFLVSAVLTPPDVVSQFLMAIPLMLLFGISILIAKKVYPYDKKSQP